MIYMAIGCFIGSLLGTLTALYLRWLFTPKPNPYLGEGDPRNWRL